MSTPREAVLTLVSPRRLIQITALAWFAVIGLDFFLDAGLLARFYRWDLPGFLPPLKMFLYIPLGYVAFLLWTILLVWLMIRLPVSGFRAGAMFGLKVGILIAAAGFFGEMSVFAFPAWMLLLWMAANTLIFTASRRGDRGGTGGAALAPAGAARGGVDPGRSGCRDRVAEHRPEPGRENVAGARRHPLGAGSVAADDLPPCRSTLNGMRTSRPRPA